MIYSVSSNTQMDIVSIIATPSKVSVVSLMDYQLIHEDTLQEGGFEAAYAVVRLLQERMLNQGRAFVFAAIWDSEMSAFYMEGRNRSQGDIDMWSLGFSNDVELGFEAILEMFEFDNSQK